MIPGHLKYQNRRVECKLDPSAMRCLLDPQPTDVESRSAGVKPPDMITTMCRLPVKGCLEVGR